MRWYQQKIKSSEHWSTPEDLYHALDFEFNFDDDPCPLNGSGGLEKEWGSCSFVNPPYGKGKEEPWILKAIEESKKGKTVVMLLKAATDTKRFHGLILPYATEIRFLRGRLKYKKDKREEFWGAPFPSMIVIFTSDNNSYMNKI